MYSTRLWTIIGSSVVAIALLLKKGFRRSRHPKVTSLNVHISYMWKAIKEAKRSIPTSKAYCVGCVLVDSKNMNILATGFSRELEGNTHAEEVALRKVRDKETSVDYKQKLIGCDCYTTMEPCSRRLSGLRSCTSRLIEAKVGRVFIGAMEPAHFVNCAGVSELLQAGIEVFLIQDPIIENASLEPNFHILKR